jgi:hypothetical protein
LAIGDSDALLLLEALEGEPMLLSELDEVWSIEDGDQLGSLLLGCLFQGLGLILLAHEELVPDLGLETTGNLGVCGLLQGEQQEVWVQEWSDLLKSIGR